MFGFNFREMNVTNRLNYKSENRILRCESIVYFKARSSSINLLSQVSEEDDDEIMDSRKFNGN